MFDKIIGNDKIKEMLYKSVKDKKTSHSYLFVGIEGIGKKEIAKEFAKMLLCISDNKYCNTCKSCIEFDSNNNPDFLYIEPEGNSVKIEQIRYIQRKIQEKPIISNKKVYIINDADKMTTEAQNCLLKTLEEPPEYSTIILIGSNENMFLSTIKSRCMIIHFSKIEDEKIRKYLEEKYELKDISTNMLEIFQGSIGKAILLKDKKEQYEKIELIIKSISQKSIIDILNMSEILYKSKEEIFDILEYINVILIKLSKIDYEYIKCINSVEETKTRLKQNANYDMSIDNMLFNMWEDVN
ncbi:MAG: DNA polymerase III subunit delta' [Clostridia bacterium]|nr:DNA polymerase III subunit delta' [Clostridium sp.]MBS6253045.1 DNA polymerase III subunit delta' [Clostridium sp.]